MQANGGAYVTGRRLTYVDLSLFQIVEGLRYAFPKRMKAFEREIPGLVGLHDRVAARPNIKAYLASDRRIAFNEDGIFRQVQGAGWLDCVIRDAPLSSSPGSASTMVVGDYGGEVHVAGRASRPSRNDVWIWCYLFRPSIGVIVSFESSMPSMQLTFSATTSVPSGLLPRANTSTPQSMQS